MTRTESMEQRKKELNDLLERMEDLCDDFYETHSRIVLEDFNYNEAKLFCENLEKEYNYNHIVLTLENAVHSMKKYIPVYVRAMKEKAKQEDENNGR